MPRKENTKARTWERDRRERMNTYFKTLSDLLPPHQDGRKRNKVDILIHAAKYIKDLHGRTEDLFHAHASDVHKEELVRLKKLVSQLFSRTQLLSTLLKEAGISIPAEPAIEKVSSFKWSNKITAEDTEKIFSKVEEKKRVKKRREKVIRNNKVPLKRKSSNNTKLLSNNDNTTPSENNNDKPIIKDQENRLNTFNNDEKLTTERNIDDNSTAGEKTNVTISTSSIEANKSAPRTRSRDKNPEAEKLDSQKVKVKRKSKTNEKNKIINNRMNHHRTVAANMTSGTLILSSGKIMPVVTPLTSNIIVNGQSQSANPIILSNAGQPNQMIVMQHLNNPGGQNSVIPMQCNQTLINTVQKVTLNPVVNGIQTNIVVSSQDWVSNVKSIMNATKINGRKCILPKGKDITKTTMTYKVPIAAVNKEKTLNLDSKCKEILNRKDGEGQKKQRNFIRGIKSLNNSCKINNVEDTLKLNDKNDNLKVSKDKESSSSASLKRILSNESSKKLDDEEPDNKKLKNDDNSSEEIINRNKESNSTCKSIESLKNVVKKIGNDMKNDVNVKENNSFSSSSSSSTIEIQKNNIISDNKNTEKPNTSPKGQEYSALTSMDKNSEVYEASKPLRSQNSNSELEKDRSGIVPNSKNLTDSDDPIESQVPSDDLSNLNDEEMPTTAFPEGITLSTDSSVIRNEKSDISLPKVSEISSPSPINDPEIGEISKDDEISEGVKEVCNLGTRFDSLLQANVKRPETIVENVTNLETSKIILNLDTNTTTTVKPESNNTIPKPLNSALINDDDNLRANKLSNFTKDEGLKSLSYSADNSFIPISRSEALHSDLSNDIFASLQVPSSSHHPESISPTAAFLMAFPLVSSLNGKTEVLEEEMKEDFKYRSHTPPMLLQIGAMEPNSFKLKTNVSVSSKDSLNPSLQHGSIEIEKKNSSLNLNSGVSHQTAKLINDNNDKGIGSPSKSSDNQFEMKNNENVQMEEKTDPREPEIETTKSLPKVLHSENVTKEQYKIVQTSIPSSLTTAIEMNNSFIYTSGTSTVSYSSTPVVTSCCAPSENQSASSTIHHSRAIAKNSALDSTANLNIGINSSFQTPTESVTPVVTSKYDLRSQYTSTQNYIPNYTNISGNIELPQYTTPTFTSSINKSTQNNQTSNHLSGLTNVSTQSATTQCHSLPKNQNYATQNKESHSVTNNNEQNSNVNNENLRQIKQQNHQDHRNDNSYHTKKIVSNNFGQNYTFDKDNGAINPQNQTIQQGNENNIAIFQAKHNSGQSYMPYSKDSKKIVGGMSSVPSSSGKPLLLENAIHNYPQNSMIGASNYEQQSTVGDNSIKSTTTVAQNSSNFSILSWTTFSPVGGSGGNNGTMNYEQGQQQAAVAATDVATESNNKTTICENFGYVQIHKENNNNVGFSNMLPEFSNENGLNVNNNNKLGNNKAAMLDTQKQQSLSQNHQTTINSTQQNNGKQNQNQSTDYKFNNNNDNNKAKGKYTIENNFMQNNYTNIEQQQQQQQQQGKQHQNLSNNNKQDKSNYPMPSYNPQVLFNAGADASSSSSQVKYSTENYTGANFKYTTTEKSQQNQNQNQKYQSTGQTHAAATPAALEQTNSTLYKQNQNLNLNLNKSKIQQMRPPVNWMMTPEIKHNTTNISDIILPPIGKELEYCQNNLFTQNTSYNHHHHHHHHHQGATNQFYNNYDTAAHSFPNIPVIQNEPKKVDTFYSEEQQPFTWSPTKNPHIVEQTQSIKPIDQHIVPSTLPTLVGDLALGTNIPEKQNFLFGQMPARIQSEHNKDLIKEKDSNATREFHAIINPQNGQHTAQGTFLSVSQLVEHEKAEKSQQARKHQRKSSSPRVSGKRQLEIRKQGVTAASGDQLHHEEQKSTVQSFAEQNYQQKYQHNDTHWNRNRNCKSNYTAEALIGTNTNVQQDPAAENQQDKLAAIKFTANYTQNKFPGGLSAPAAAADTMMPINYFPNTTDDGNNYGQANQNFNSYASYSSNANIYPTTNFITSISNTPASSYMMPLHENPDYLETNSFLLPNASTSNAIKTQHYTGKHQNCDKRSYSTVPKRGKRKPAAAAAGDMTQNIDFPLSGMNSPLEDYHSSFLSHANLYQNPPQSSIYTKTVNTNLPGSMTGNHNSAVGSAGLSGMNSNIPRGTSANSPMVMAHPSGTSLTNFNLSTIFPEINDKVAGYKPPNSMPPGLPQPTGHGSNYTQRTNYSNPLGHVPQVSEPTQFANNMPPSSSVHYKNS